MGRIVKFKVVDAKGDAAAGQNVVAGEVGLTTTAGGAAQALLDDGNTTISVNGIKAYDGPVSDLRALEVFTIAGKRVD